MSVSIPSPKSAPTAAQKPYLPKGSALSAMRSVDREVLLCGPVRTGKTRTWCEKIHFLCERYPGARFLMARQTRESMTATTLATFEDDVLPDNHPAKSGPNREGRSLYRYPNGSEIIVGGLDKPSRILGSEYDGVFIAQAEECMPDSVETLKTRLSHYVVPWQQLMMDANPGPPNHWLKKRCDSGATRLIEARFADNPKYCRGTGAMPPDDDSRYWSGSDWTELGLEFLRAEGWTVHGIDYLAQLQGIRGHRRGRLVHGLWQAPEGARFEGATKAIQGFSMHSQFPHGIPTSWARWLSGDYGRADPYCCLWHAMDPEGTIWTYMEDYQRGFEADQQAGRIIQLSPLNDPRYMSMHMDASMWNPAESFGGDKVKGPAAEQYAKAFAEFNAEIGYERFGRLVKGARNINEEAYVTLDVRLRNGSWRIADSCINLWREIEDAVYYKDPRTSIAYELINPHDKKYCDDHALEAAGYGIHKRAPTTKQQKDDTIDYEKVAAARAARIVTHSERRHRGKRRGFGAARNG